MSELCAWISSARLMNGASSRGVPPADAGVTIARSRGTLRRC